MKDKKKKKRKRTKTQPLPVMYGYTVQTLEEEVDKVFKQIMKENPAQTDLFN